MDRDQVDLLSTSYERVRSRVGVKWSRHGGNVLAGWVADMDFDPPRPLLDAIRGHIDRGDLGYGPSSRDLAPVYVEWQARQHGWTPDVGKVRAFTSALHALEVALWHLTEPGDGVVVCTPIYYPFLDAIADSGRRRVEVPLDPSGWRLDPERLEAAIDDTTRVILFCHPHNPTGRVFDEREIRAVADVAERHDLVVITDEIWGELTHGVAHRPLAICDDRFANRLVTLGSASKTFNTAGLRTAVAHVDHPPLERALDSMPSHMQGSPSTLGIAATIVSWTQCDDWLAAVQRTITARRDQLAARLAADLPQVGFDPPQATYLGWLDFSNVGFGDEPAKDLLAHAGVALSNGLQFGSGGAGCARLNFSTSAEILDDMLDRIAEAVHERGHSA